MTFEELAIRFALALATRPHTDFHDTNRNAIEAAKDLLEKIEKAKEQE